ncbi:MAG: transcriptional repressor LexA [Candidatus Nanopelagicales bacterium]|nr:transcriptional repressor LexA [Candidatus Nanopelagicales bacterium]MDZ4249710.1 transcriptional repressor LexA [Candidatus Nanopelagicales bacterium]
MSDRDSEERTNPGSAASRGAGHGLTERQRAILEAIHASVTERGYPPSIREVGQATGLTSPSTVAHHLHTLERKGFLRRDPRRPRALVLTEKAESVTEVSAGRRRDRDPAHAKIIDLTSASPDDTDGAGGTSGAVYVPLVGRISAGGPILAEQSVEAVFPLPREIVGHGTLFLLRVVGDSMVQASICDGDYVVVRGQPEAENGEIVAAILDDEATVKTLRKRDDHVWLLPQNPAYEPILGDDARILGKVVSVLRRI